MRNLLQVAAMLCFFNFSFAASAQAQTKTAYAIVTYIPSLRKVSVSINGDEFREFRIERKEVQGWSDLNPALREINKMGDEGWELIDTEVAQHASVDKEPTYVFYLRKQVIGNSD